MGPEDGGVSNGKAVGDGRATGSQCEKPEQYWIMEYAL